MGIGAGLRCWFGTLFKIASSKYSFAESKHSLQQSAGSVLGNLIVLVNLSLAEQTYLHHDVPGRASLPFCPALGSLLPLLMRLLTNDHASLIPPFLLQVLISIPRLCGPTLSATTWLAPIINNLWACLVLKGNLGQAATATGLIRD